MMDADELVLEAFDCERWPIVFVPAGTKVIYIVYTWSSYQDRVEMGDCEVL